MKHLKFKAWDKVKMNMFKPLAITFDTQSLMPFAVSVPGRSWEPIHKYELLQFTGLFDKNGVEVYQEDLFEINSCLHKVIWSDTNASFMLEEIKTSSTLNITEVLNHVILGNTFQNSDLLS